MPAHHNNSALLQKSNTCSYPTLTYIFLITSPCDAFCHNRTALPVHYVPSETYQKDPRLSQKAMNTITLKPFPFEYLQILNAHYPHRIRRKYGTYPNTPFSKSPMNTLLFFSVLHHHAHSLPLKK